MIQSYRLVWLSGRFSGGKTSLSLKLAEEFLKQGYMLFTNTKCVWNDDIKAAVPDEFGKLKAVCIMDEAGLGLKATRQVQAMAAYAAKMDMIYLFPSYFPPIRSAQVLTIQVLFSLRGIGIPLIIYKWRVKLGAFEDKGFFAWWMPSEVWGIYSRNTPEADIDEFIFTVAEQVEAFRQRWGVKKENSLFRMEEEISEDDRLSSVVEALEEVGDSITSFSTRRAKRR